MLGSVLNRLDHLVDIKIKATHGLGSLRDRDEVNKHGLKTHLPRSTPTGESFRFDISNRVSGWGCLKRTPSADFLRNP